MPQSLQASRNQSSRVKTKTNLKPRGVGSFSSGGGRGGRGPAGPGQPLQHDITRASKEALSGWSVSPAHKRGLSEGHRVPLLSWALPSSLIPSSREGTSAGLSSRSATCHGSALAAPARPDRDARLAACVECWPTKCGDVVTKVQGIDQRHTLDLQVPSPIPRPPAMGAASGGFRAGDTVHLERGTQASPWVKGGDWG